MTPLRTSKEEPDEIPGMDYRYTGDAHLDLLQSLEADEEPFPTSKSMHFPAREHSREEVDMLKRLLFPRCWNAHHLFDREELLEQFNALGRCMYTGIKPYVEEAKKREKNGGATLSEGAQRDSAEIVTAVLDRLPEIRRLLKTDVTAAYKGDPAATSYIELIRSYPGVQAIMIQRFAHALYETGAREYARELTEYGKTMTGIDIHPGADIDESFFIDHGTGVVIGETARVGKWVRLYQDVTLGALHFEEDENEDRMLKKGYKRHPNIGDNVVIGAGAKVLGDIDIGDHVSIGANAWIVEDIPEHTRVIISKHPDQERKRKE